MKKLLLITFLLSTVLACTETYECDILRPTNAQNGCTEDDLKKRIKELSERGIAYDISSDNELYKKGEFVVTFKEEFIQVITEEAKSQKGSTLANLQNAVRDSIKKIAPGEEVAFRQCDCFSFMLVEIRGGVSAPNDMPIIMSVQSIDGVKGMGHNLIGTATEITANRNKENKAAKDTPKIQPSDVVVGVVDTGLDTQLFDDNQLAANRYFNANPPVFCAPQLNDRYGYNFIGPLGLSNSDTDNNPADDNPLRHGSNISADIVSIFDAQKNKKITVKILPVKSFDANGIGDQFTATCGIIYAVNRGARIINASFVFKTKRKASLSGLEFAVNYAKNKGTLIVAAAGNSGCALDTAYGVYPAMFYGDSLDNIITVASALKGESGYYVPRFSNTGATYIHIGARASTLNKFGMSLNCEQRHGTSYSTGMVSGFAAAVLSLNFTQDYRTLRQSILTNLNVETHPNLQPYIEDGRVLVLGF